jgi:hypothetical protein
MKRSGKYIIFNNGQMIGIDTILFAIFTLIGILILSTSAFNATHREAVLAVLRDPNSAIFGSSYIGKYGAGCGLVNARNGFGGMSGMRRYVVAGRITMIDDGKLAFEMTWNDLCKLK